MAKLKSSSSPAAADTFPLFVETNLDTHFLINVSSEDTFGDLRGKLKSHHAFCFPSIGDINIQSMKVKRKDYYYHLVDSMHVIRAFNGIKGTCFLRVDVISACHQDKTVENAVNHDDGQSQDQLFDSAPNACTSGVKAGGVYGFLMHGPSDENSLAQIDKNGEYEKQNLPDIHDDDLVPSNANTDASGHLNLSSGGLLNWHHMSLTEHEKMTSGNVPGVRQQVEGDHRTDKVVDKGEGNAREEHHGTTNEVDNDVFSVKKKNLEKSCNVVHNDSLLEKDGSSIERKKHKKKKDGSSEVPIGDPSVEYGSCKLSKETSAAENIFPETYSLEKHEPVISLACDDFPLKALATEEKKRKKREKKEKTPREAFTKNVTDADKETNSAIFVDKATIPVTDGDPGKVGANTVPLPSDLKGAKSSRSKKSKTLSKSVNSENHQEASENIPKDLNVVSDGINTTGGAIYQENPTGGFCAPFDANTKNTRRSRRNKSDRTKSESSSLQPRGQEIGGIPEENALLGESTVLENPALENSTVVSNPNGRSSHEKRKRKAKAQPPNIKSINEEPIHPLEKEATRDKPDEILEDKCKEDKADFIGEVAPPETLADNSIEKVIEGNTEVLLGLNHENSISKTMQLMTQNEHAESSVADDHVEILKSDTEKVNFIDFFIPKASQLDPNASVEEPPSMATDSEKPHKEKHRRKRKPNSDGTQVQLPVSKDKHSKRHKAKTASISESENKRVPYLDENVNINTMDANLAFSKSSPVAVTENPFSSCADVSMKETMADLVASGDRTEAKAPTQTIKYKVVVSKPPSKKSGENLSKTSHQKSLIATSSTIFNGSMSKTSEDEIYKFPGVGSSSHSKDDDGSDGIILTQPSSEVKKSSGSLSMILRSTSSYMKAEATALQLQHEDGQSHVVMETQPTSP